MPQDANHSELPAEVRRIGAETVASTVGAVLGAVVGGVPGSIVGASATPSLVYLAHQAVTEFCARFLSQQERRRVDTVATLALEGIQTRLDRGDERRQDQFFDPRVADGRSDVEEIFEAVLLRAKQEAQERKIPFLANIFANAAFASVPAADVHAVVTLAERMSYRQYALLALAKRCDEFRFETPLQFRRTGYTTHPQKQFVLRDWEELRSPGIGVVDPPAFVEGPRVHLTAVGEACYELMGLAEFPTDEIKLITALFSGTSTF